MFVKSIQSKSKSIYIGSGKRLFDIALSLTAILLLSPVFIVIWVVVKISSKQAGLFRHSRVGKNGSSFTLYKFRTMKNDSGIAGPSVTSLSDNRVTNVGRVLRKYKLDELPQLYNVLVGDMSLVGPRPEAKKYVDLFKEDYSYILQVTPGITDYAALEFRNEEQILDGYDDVEEAYINEVLPLKIVLYKKYIEEMSFRTDIRIIARTIIEVVKN